MKVKKFLKAAAQHDRDEILNSEQGQALLNKLLNDEVNKIDVKKTNSLICPDCGNELTFNAKFGVFMHTNCEKLNCWYMADEFGKCMDNNQKRAARIYDFTGLNY